MATTIKKAKYQGKDIAVEYAVKDSQGNVISTSISENKTNINLISDVIPEQTYETDNELADKKFVNSSINNVVAYYITKQDGNPFATKLELTSATTFYSGGEVRTPTRNDYAIVLADESKDGATTRYIYNNAWQFQYVVNSTPFTSDQLEAINSGITSTLVGKISANESNISSLGGTIEDLSDELESKVDKISTTKVGVYAHNNATQTEIEVASSVGSNNNIPTNSAVIGYVSSALSESGKVNTISINNGSAISPDTNKNINLTINKTTVGLENVANRGIDSAPISGSSNYITSNAVANVNNSAIHKNMLTTKGDIITHNGVNVDRYPIGSNGRYLRVLNGGISWEKPDYTWNTNTGMSILCDTQYTSQFGYRVADVDSDFGNTEHSTDYKANGITHFQSTNPNGIWTYTFPTESGKLALTSEIPTKLSDLEADIDLGKVEDVKVNGTSVVVNKVANISVPDTTNFATKTELNAKQDKMPHTTETTAYQRTTLNVDTNVGFARLSLTNTDSGDVEKLYVESDGKVYHGLNSSIYQNEFPDKSGTLLVESDIADMLTKTEAQSTYALSSDIPTTIGELDNDVGYITNSAINDMLTKTEASSTYVAGTADTSATANTIVKRDASGNINGKYIQGTWLKSTDATENASYTDFWVNSGGWLYKRSKANVINDLGIVSEATINAKINSMSAVFRGNFATKSALDAIAWQTTNPSGANFVSNNDYAVVEADETHDGQQWRYLYISGWNAQYKVNDTPITEDVVSDWGFTKFDGSYNSLTDKPTLFSGSYNDLTDKPTIKNEIIKLTDSGSTTAGTWVASTSEITSLVEGQIFLYKIVVAGASATTLNINGYGAKNVYRRGTTAISTSYPVDSYILLYYTGSAFCLFNDYDANSYAYVRQYQHGTNTAGTTNKYPLLARYNLTNKNASYDTAYSRFHTDAYVDISTGKINAKGFTIDGTDIVNFSGNYNDLSNKPTIPTSTSQLTNDSGFITSASIPSVPTKTSDLTNDSGFITSSSIPSVPTNVSAFTNDSGYITSSYHDSSKQDVGHYMISADYSNYSTSLQGLVDAVRYTSGTSGSCALSGAESYGIPSGWYNLFYSPHRFGTNNGDNHLYGTLILCPMTFDYNTFVIRVSGGVISSVKALATTGDIPSFSFDASTGTLTIS